MMSQCYWLQAAVGEGPFGMGGDAGAFFFFFPQMFFVVFWESYFVLIFFLKIFALPLSFNSSYIDFVI